MKNIKTYYTEDFTNIAEEMGLSKIEESILLTTFKNNKDAKTLENALNSIKDENMYDVLDQGDGYIITEVLPKMSYGKPGNTGWNIFGDENSDLFNLFPEIKNGDNLIDELASNPKHIEMIETIGKLFEENIGKLEENIKDNPKTYTFKSIKDILEVVDSENVDYFIQDFSQFIKGYLAIKTSSDIALEFLPDDVKDILGDNVENLIETPDSFEWIDDGKVGGSMEVSFVDENMNEDGKMIFDFDKKDIEVDLDISLEKLEKMKNDFFEKLFKNSNENQDDENDDTNENLDDDTNEKED